MDLKHNHRVFEFVQIAYKCFNYLMLRASILSIASELNMQNKLRGFVVYKHIFKAYLPLHPSPHILDMHHYGKNYKQMYKRTKGSCNWKLL